MVGSPGEIETERNPKDIQCKLHGSANIGKILEEWGFPKKKDDN